MIDLPDTVLCEKCGADATVVACDADMQALAGKMAPSDRRWDEGFFYSIDCPTCGGRMQCLSPPP